LRFSTIISNLGIHDKAKWQFYNKTQPPFAFASSIYISALLSYPYPSDINSVLLGYMSISDANFLKSATGSEPELRTKIRGFTTYESLKQSSKLNVGGSMNSLPIFSMI
jgi:hypothetical protein